MDGPPKGSDSTDPGGRGKLDGMAAVSIQHAIDMLDAGDVAGARAVLLALLGDEL